MQQQGIEVLSFGILDVLPTLGVLSPVFLIKIMDLLDREGDPILSISVIALQNTMDHGSKDESFCLVVRLEFVDPSQLV